MGRTLVVAVAPSSSSEAKQRKCQVRFFRCDIQATPTGDMLELENAKVPVHVWKWHDSYTSELDEIGAPVTHLVTSQTALVAADISGTCGTWQKNKGFSRRYASRQLHKGSIADVSVERFFLYTCGHEDRTISIWSVPDLQPIMEIFAEIPRDLLLGFKCSGNGSSVVAPRKVFD